VVTTADGVAAFAFTDRVHLGTGYTFRFRPAGGGKEQAGGGKVFERYKAVQGPGGPNDVSYQYDGGELSLAAGSVKVLWSRGGERSGWLYFDPDRVKVEAVEGGRPGGTRPDAVRQEVPPNPTAPRARAARCVKLGGGCRARPTPATRSFGRPGAGF
jgi:hypothetical protein